MLKCSIENCSQAKADKLAIIDDGKHVLLLCPEHLIAYAMNDLHEKNMELRKSRFHLQSCEICGAPAILYAAEVELQLCRSHLTKLLRRQLSVAEYRILADKHGRFPLISEDYYSSGGFAMQPL